MNFESVRFAVHSNDHPPRHVHGIIGKTVVIVDVLPNGTVQLAKRPRPIRPKNAKRSDVKKVLKLAAAHSKELNTLWEKVHGQA